MKLSEAMMLGSTTCKMVAADWNSCGLGCAGNAVGIPQEDAATLTCPDGRDRYEHIYGQWPWLWADGYGPQIWMTFDKQVCEGRMTFEQLVDWVASIEPSCGECNRFKCSCVKSEAVPVTEEVGVA